MQIAGISFVRLGFVPWQDERIWFRAKIFIGQEGGRIVRLTAYITHMKGICGRIISMRKPCAVVPYFAIIILHDINDLAVSTGKWQAFAL